MKIYFNANNKATLEALQKCGVKNVLVSHRYSYANIDKFRGCFDKIFTIAGTKDNPDKYHEFLKEKKECYDYAAQYNIPYNMVETMKYLTKERELDLKVLPVLQEDYIKHLSLLNPEPNSYICVGKMRGRLDTDDSIKKLPTNIKYHGLGKGKFTARGIFESIDTSLWISAAMSKKLEVWCNGITPILLSETVSHHRPVLEHYCELYKDNLERVGINIKSILNNHYYSLLRLPIALFYMPICRHLNCYEENFNS